MPLVKKLIDLPPNLIFDCIYYFCQLYVYRWTDDLGWRDTFMMGYYYKRNNFDSWEARSGKAKKRIKPPFSGRGAVNPGP